jgi:hypothetical protein
MNCRRAHASTCFEKAGCGSASVRSRLYGAKVRSERWRGSRSPFGDEIKLSSAFGQLGTVSAGVEKRLLTRCPVPLRDKEKAVSVTMKLACGCSGTERGYAKIARPKDLANVP